MRRYVPALATALLALGTSVMAAGPASAFGGETLGCSISPGRAGTGFCSTSSIPSSGYYSVSYNVQGGSGTYTYSWTNPGGTVIFGCTSTSNSCAIRVPAVANDQYLTASVVITQGTSHATLSATAFIPAVCGSYFC